MSAAEAAKKIVKHRKPSVRSLYDYQESCVVPMACRNDKAVMIGTEEISAGRILRRPFQFFQSKMILPRMQEHFIVRAMHHYCVDWESPFTKHIYETEATSVRLNMVYLHMWLLKYHLNNSVLKDSDFVKEEIKSDWNNKARTKINSDHVYDLQQRLIKQEHVKVYTNSFDDAIHEELKRQYRAIDHSLSAIFMHSPRSLSDEQRLVSRLDDDDLEELILYNILNEEPEAKREQIKRLSDYIRISVHEEDKYSFSTRMESYYYSANVDTLFKEHAEVHRLERFRQVKAD